jgi:hypothetical protein
VEKFLAPVHPRADATTGVVVHSTFYWRPPKSVHEWWEFTGKISREDVL